MISMLQVRVLANAMQNPVVPFPGAEGQRKPPANVPAKKVTDPEKRTASPWTGKATPLKPEEVHTGVATERAKEFGSP